MKAKKKKPQPRPKPSEVFNPLHNADRLIYQFFDGSKNRKVDPLVILTGLRKAEGVNFETDIKLIQAGAAAEKNITDEKQREHFKKNALDAQDRILGAARTVFGVEPYNGDTDKGLTNFEVLEIVANFANFMGVLEDQTRPLSNSPPSTAAESSPPSPTTEPTSVSTSAETESKPVT